MKVVITGGAGKLGQHAIREFATHGHNVICLDLVPSSEVPCCSQVVDLTDINAICNAIQGSDAVVHLGRKPFPYTYTAGAFNPSTRGWNLSDNLGDCALLNYNIAVTNNVLSACCEVGVEKLVVGSSLAIYGFYYPIRRCAPEYIPVDEQHPLRPQDPYGLSKLIGEESSSALARRRDTQVASLRFAGIITDLSHRILIERRADPVRWTGSLWSYIDVRDAAVACRVSVESDFVGHHAFNICSPTTLMKSPTLQLIREYLPTGTTINIDRNDNWSGYSAEKALRLLGFRARFLVE